MPKPNSEDDVKQWQTAFFRLFDWLDSDRDRHKAVLRASLIDVFRVDLYIDHHIVSAADGYEIPDVVAEAMNGMVIPELGGIAVEDNDA